VPKSGESTSEIAGPESGGPGRRVARGAVAGLDAVADDGTRRVAEDVAHPGMAHRRDDPTIGGHRPDEPSERGLHVIEVAVDVGVVELDRGQDQRVRVVVEELRRLVEEGGVVLVALDDEVVARTLAKRAAEVERDAADQQGRIPARRGQHLGDEVRRRRLAVRPGDGDAVAARDRQLVERVRERAVGNAGLDRRLRLGIVGADRVPDHDEVGLGIEDVSGRESLEHVDAPVRERGAHRRVQLLVGAGDVDAARLQEARQRPHARAADGDEVDTLEPFRDRGALGMPGGVGGRAHPAVRPSTIASCTLGRRSNRLRLAT
jgi:hypothetical protein